MLLLAWVRVHARVAWKKVGRMSNTIEFDAVTKRYKAESSADRGPAVDAFSARVQAGTTTVLLGSSGCGKTTLLRKIGRAHV